MAAPISALQRLQSSALPRRTRTIGQNRSLKRLDPLSLVHGNCALDTMLGWEAGIGSLMGNA